jgi:hypothetical protein
MSRHAVPRGRRGATCLPIEDPGNLSDDSNTDEFTVIGVPQQSSTDQEGKRAADAGVRARNTIMQEGVSSPWPSGTMVLGLSLFLVGGVLVVRSAFDQPPLPLIVPPQSQALGLDSPHHSVARGPSSSHLAPTVASEVARSVAPSIAQSLANSLPPEQPNLLPPPVTPPPQAPSPAPLLPPPLSPTSPPLLTAVCLRSFSATGVFRPPRTNSLPHPQLWVYLWQGGHIAGKSSVAHTTLQPVSKCTHHARDRTRAH